MHVACADNMWSAAGVAGTNGWFRAACCRMLALSRLCGVNVPLILSPHFSGQIERHWACFPGRRVAMLVAPAPPRKHLQLVCSLAPTLLVTVIGLRPHRSDCASCDCVNFLAEDQPPAQPQYHVHHSQHAHRTRREERRTWWSETWTYFSHRGTRSALLWAAWQPAVPTTQRP